MNAPSYLCPNCGQQMITWGGRVSDSFCESCGCSFFHDRSFSKLELVEVTDLFKRVKNNEIRAGRKYCPKDNNGLVALAGHHGPFVTELVCHICGGVLIYPQDLEQIVMRLKDNNIQSEIGYQENESLEKSSISKRKKISIVATGMIAIFTISLSVGMSRNDISTSRATKAKTLEYCTTSQIILGATENTFWCQSESSKKLQIEKISCEGVYLGRELEASADTIHFISFDDKVCYLKVSDSESKSETAKMIYVGTKN